MNSKVVDTAEQPLMAQALADEVGATKRQIQLWTDAGALQAFPELQHRPGRGRQRLYPRSEIRYAAMAAELGRYQIPIGRIAGALSCARAEIADRFGTSNYARWCRKAWRGGVQSCFLFYPDGGFAWCPPELVMVKLSHGYGAIVVPVHTIVSHHPDE